MPKCQLPAGRGKGNIQLPKLRAVVTHAQTRMYALYIVDIFFGFIVRMNGLPLPPSSHNPQPP